MDNIVKSPCVNICQLGEDNICIGCYRTLGEIGDWRFANSDQREQIVAIAKMRQSNEKQSQ